MEQGFSLTKPGRFSFLETYPDGELHACPVGAACYARDPRRQIFGLGSAEALFPELGRTVFLELDRFSDYERRWLEAEYTFMFRHALFKRDGVLRLEFSLGSLVMMLRDGLNWSNEQILNWVRELGY
jgi:hypothetical protein